MAAKTSSQQSAILKRQKFDASEPGTIVADFEALLDFIGTEGIKTGGKNRRIPLASLNGLDERMTKPLRPNLERPQQLSFPNLNGLYLLARTTALAVARGEGATGRLTIDADRLAEWSLLNPTEKYFTLLQALIDSKWDVIESRHGSFGPMQYLWYVVSPREKPWQLGKEGSPATSVFVGWDEQAIAALLEMFGILEIRSLPAQPGENWRVQAIQLTEFGGAILPLLDQFDSSYSAPWPKGKKAKKPWIGDGVRRYHPECEKTLTVPTWDFVEGVWQFRVSWGKVWRRILISSHRSADDLAHAILDAYKFDDDHLYEFKVSERTGSVVSIAHPVVEDAEYATDKFTVGSFPLDPGNSMIFLFDYGDNWQFKVTLEAVLPPDPRLKKPKVTESHGTAPRQYGHDEDDEDW